MDGNKPFFLPGFTFKHGRMKDSTNAARSGFMEYLETRMSAMPQNRKSLMCFKSPFLVKNCFQYLPEHAILLGNRPTSSWI